ncbi:Acetamidase [Lachnellula hyalina]|uniref:Acetamidase n=1 Tax=Lachnellula hyalina TaxID=1316788 RepID=A0A8H8TW08_9HELO|nr:Acetamidase [Lachnellula hyalina]TVY23922.1 Acetamidase [Lachnellula hyalina]
MVYRELSHRKKAEQAARIPEAWKVDTRYLFEGREKSIIKQLTPENAPSFWSGVLSEKEIGITTGNDAVDIVDGIREGKWSAEEVTTAFCKRAALAHQLTNCLTEIFFEEAIQQARTLDQARNTHPETPLGPLHGLPISLKDTYHVPGVDATIGLACFAFQPSTSYSPLAELLVSLGAVLYCKTNIPQTLMTADSENNLFGRTINPHNRYLTAGGSTGGEGPLIALGGSVLGFGTDIAGSLRIPALCNGVYGFKPSSGIMPFSGQRLPFAPGWEGIGIVASAGPMASSVRACSFALKAILKSVPSDVDPMCLRIPWYESAELARLKNPKSLRIGVVGDDGLFTITPPVRRAMKEAEKKLKLAGVTTVHVKLPLMLELLGVIGEMLAVNGTEYLMDLIHSTGEPLIPSVEKLGLLAGSPKTMGEYFELNRKRQDIALVYSKFWIDNNLDALIMPPAPHTAVPENAWAVPSYTAIWNLLDYPSIVLPTGAVNEMDILEGTEDFYSENDKEVYKLYDGGPSAYEHAPIAIQLVSKKQDDQALTVIAGVEDATFIFLQSFARSNAADAIVYMFFVSVIRYALVLLVPLSLILSSYLYLYPVFHLCAFPAPEEDANTAYTNTLRQHLPFSTHDATKVAPFRLLALGDPQLEGTSPLDDPEAAAFPNLAKFWKDALLLDGTNHNPLQRLRYSLHDLVDFYLDDIPNILEVYRKKLDHVGNDYYLGHIYRTMHWWTDPSHITVLGDLVGSQWIEDDEFEKRGWRFWNRVFKGGERIYDEVASAPSEDFQDNRILGEYPAAWKQIILNVPGNHDIGYAGDISPERVERFDRVFGKPNYELRFHLPVNGTSIEGNSTGNGEDEPAPEEKPVPELRIIIFNDMNLDTPASSKEMQDQSYGFLNDVITSSHDVDRQALFTIVLTHIPMHKEAGICVDGPFFDFYDGYFDNGVKEQNHLSQSASKGFLEGVFGMSGDPGAPGSGFGRNGVILTGHDHEGCDTYHYINQSDPPEREWHAMKWKDAVDLGVDEQPGVPGLREITVRSMMGDFTGNAGLMSLWFDEEEWDWKFKFVNCEMGTQHIWWIVHIVDLITLGVGLVYGILVAVEKLTFRKGEGSKKNHMSNGKIPTSNGAAKVGNGKIGAYLAEYSQTTNGKLDVPGAGKKSLRKKKSKRNL